MLSPDDDPKLLMHAYVDGELDPANARAIERRIAGDAVLAAERDRIEALQRVLRSKFPLVPVPTHLRERIERAVGFRRLPVRPTWLALAASVALAVSVGSSSTFYALAPRGDAARSRRVRRRHRRAAALVFLWRRDDRVVRRPFAS